MKYECSDDESRDYYVSDLEGFNRFELAQVIKRQTFLISMFSWGNGVISSIGVLCAAAMIAGEYGFFPPEVVPPWIFLSLCILAVINYGYCRYYVDDQKAKRTIAYLFLENRVEDFVRTGKSFSVRDYHTKEKIIH